MNPSEPTTKALDELRSIELWLRAHNDERELINRAVFSVANAMKVHPHDLALYILLRTTSL
jgi:hypothetical protein